MRRLILVSNRCFLSGNNVTRTYGSDVPLKSFAGSSLPFKIENRLVRLNNRLVFFYDLPELSLGPMLYFENHTLMKNVFVRHFHLVLNCQYTCQPLRRFDSAETPSFFVSLFCFFFWF